MKTNFRLNKGNNVQKTIKKSLAVIISLVLIGVTVNAQEFWETVLGNNSFSQIAMIESAGLEVSSAPVSGMASANTEALVELSTLDTEEALIVEGWMIDDASFLPDAGENWVTDENLFTGEVSNIQQEKESVLEIEEWMTNAEYFEIQTMKIAEEADEQLEVEHWMLNNKVWDN